MLNSHYITFNLQLRLNRVLVCNLKLLNFSGLSLKLETQLLTKKYEKQRDILVLLIKCNKSNSKVP